MTPSSLSCSCRPVSTQTPALQIVYLVLGAWGGGSGSTAVRAGPGSRWDGPLPPNSLSSVAAVAVATVPLTILLVSAHDIAPFWDALTTSLSLAAQWLLNTKKVQNWYFWIAADVIYVPLYFVKHLWLTGIVYAIFLAMCVAGLQAWRAAYRAERLREHSSVAPVAA